MILFIYNLGIALFGFLLKCLALFNSQIKEWNKLRNLHLSELIIETNKPLLLVHCASLGEYEQIKPLLKRLNDTGKFYIILTFFSPSGYLNVAHKGEGVVDHIMYLPLDLKSNMKSFVDKIKPSIFIGVKYEYWWNLLNELVEIDTTIIYTNVSHQTKPYFFQWPLSRFKSLVHQFAKIYTINDLTLNVFKNEGFHNVERSGDMRIENVIDKKELNIKADSQINTTFKTFVWGSVYISEISMINSVIEHTLSEMNHIIVPHHVDQKTISNFENKLSVDFNLSSVGDMNSKVTLVDEIGKLFSLYSVADFVYIGGSLTSNGLHNIYEPLVFRTPICFGNNYHKFPEAIDMISKGAAIAVDSSSDVLEYIRQFENHRNREKVEEILNDYFSSGISYSDRIMEFIVNR